MSQPFRSSSSREDLLDQLVAKHKVELQKRDALIAERDAAIAQREGELRQRHVTIAALEGRVRQLEQQIETLKQEAGHSTNLAQRTPVPLPGRARRSRNYWLPALLFGLAVLFLILHQTGFLVPVESVLQAAFAPLQLQSERLVTGVGDLFRSVGEARELRAEVETLREQVDALGIENVRLGEFEAEATQLRAMLGFADENPTWVFLGADVVSWSACANAPCGQVLGQEPNAYLRYLSLNIGSEEGVGVGMPVVTGGSVLVGRVGEAGLYSSKVQLLNDVSSGIAAFLQQSRTTGLVEGQPDGTLLMNFVSQDDEVQVGDMVLTSGLGGVLPRGLIIGQVTDVQQRDFELFQQAVVRPAVDYRQLEMLLVISSFQPTTPAEEEIGVQP